MKRRPAIIFGAIFALALAAPAWSQYGEQPYGPQILSFPVSFPWFSNQMGESFGQFLANHPQVGNELAQNPELIYNAGWRASHPDLEAYLNANPGEWAQLMSYGDYDNNNQWHDAYWWHQNNPDFFYSNHPQWANFNPLWLAEDGAYDTNHTWHYGEWWYNQNPGWVSSNHPNWLSEHRNWAMHTEFSDHRSAMLNQNLAMNMQDRNLRAASVQQEATTRQQATRQQQASNQQDRQRATATQQRERQNQQATTRQQQQRQQTAANQQDRQQRAVSQQQEATRKQQATRQEQATRQQTAANQQDRQQRTTAHQQQATQHRQATRQVQQQARGEQQSRQQHSEAQAARQPQHAAQAAHQEQARPAAGRAEAAHGEGNK